MARLFYDFFFFRKPGESTPKSAVPPTAKPVPPPSNDNNCANIEKSNPLF